MIRRSIRNLRCQLKRSSGAGIRAREQRWNSQIPIPLEGIRSRTAYTVSRLILGRSLFHRSTLGLERQVANLNIPIFNGFRLNDQASEASFHAQVTKENTRALREEGVQDVDAAWLNASTALERVNVTEALLHQADTAAQSPRYLN
jgi:outer membrane protein TolC